MRASVVPESPPSTNQPVAAHHTHRGMTTASSSRRPAEGGRASIRVSSAASRPRYSNAKILPAHSHQCGVDSTFKIVHRGNAMAKSRTSPSQRRQVGRPLKANVVLAPASTRKAISTARERTRSWPIEPWLITKGNQMPANTPASTRSRSKLACWRAVSPVNVRLGMATVRPSRTSVTAPRIAQDRAARE